MPPQAVFSLLELACAALALRLPADASPGSPELTLLLDTRKRVGNQARILQRELARSLLKPVPQDLALCQLAKDLGLSQGELLAVTLTIAVDSDFLTGRAIAYLQHPVGGSRPTLGLLTETLRPLDPVGCSDALSFSSGQAFAHGLLLPLGDNVPLPERPLGVPAFLAQALAGKASLVSGTQILEGPELTLPSNMVDACKRHAQALQDSRNTVLLLRSPSRDESRSAACLIANALGGRVALLDNTQTPGLAIWLHLLRLVPVLQLSLTPGETRLQPAIPGHTGALLLTAGPDGSVDLPGCTLITWALAAPSPSERGLLWQQALPGVDGLDDIAAAHRHGAARIHQLARIASHRAMVEGLPQVNGTLLRKVSASGEGSMLENLAQPLAHEIPEGALVLSPRLKAEIEALLARCRARDGLADRLGRSATVRYTPGVRALFTGPSGTGKTLGACWIASRLSMPLYRVDLAAVTSKYIGETEKNLSQLFAHAEACDVILLFDEADSLFGRRTDIRDSHDRYANAQTNYLLQRMETFEGIALLTSNSRSRFDSAFMRRLDLVIDFPLPSASERRAIWESHLGEASALSPQELNLLAGQCDFPGGQIRNIVLAAAVEARAADGKVTLPLLLRALGAEYRKAAKPLPQSLEPAIPLSA
jgi:hypothetical protein